jgi:hypothetical protein
VSFGRWFASNDRPNGTTSGLSRSSHCPACNTLDSVTSPQPHSNTRHPISIRLTVAQNVRNIFEFQFAKRRRIEPRTVLVLATLQLAVFLPQFCRITSGYATTSATSNHPREPYAVQRTGRILLRPLLSLEILESSLSPPSSSMNTYTICPSL